MRLVKKLFSKINVDGAIFYTILSRVIQAFGGIVSIVFIAKFLDLKEQGYYYTFVSLIAIQIFFELGLSGIITQYVAHEFAYLKWADGDVIGDEYHKSRLSSLLKFCVKWFGIISFFLFFLLILVGFSFFLHYDRNLGIEWKGPWILLCLGTSLNLFIDPILAFMDGLGAVKEMAKVRLVQKSIYTILLFLFLLSGFKLFASGLAAVISIGVNYLQIFLSDQKPKLKSIWRLHSDWSVNYMKEIFPYQWRIALSWISGYFIFQLFSPVLFATEGAIIAGQMGMTMQALNGIAGVSMSWIATKVPALSDYIAKKDYHKLDELFNKMQKSMLTVNGVLLSVLIMGVYILRYYDLYYGTRFLPLLPVALLAITCFVNQAVYSWATYLRCHKKEPFLINSLVIGVLCCLSTIFFGKYFGLQGIVYGYTFIAVFITLPWAYFIFNTKKTQWHN